MKEKFETKVQMACSQIPGYLKVTQLLEQYILIHGLSKATYESYNRKLADLALYFNKLPEYITEDELREYLANLVKHAKSISKTEFKHTVYSMRFYFKMLGRPMAVSLPKIKDNKSLPAVLSKQECLTIIKHTKNFKHRLILMFIYSAGLRVRELTNLKWIDINVNRMMIHVKQSKGRKDRYVPLAKSLLADFLQYMSASSNTEYVFLDQMCIVNEPFRYSIYNETISQTRRNKYSRSLPTYLAAQLCHSFIRRWFRYCFN